MRIRTTGVKGPAILAQQLQEWGGHDSPDLSSATARYIAAQWLEDGEAMLERVRAICAELRRTGAAGDTGAAIIACRLESFLEQHGYLQLHWADGPHDSRRGERPAS